METTIFDKLVERGIITESKINGAVVGLSIEPFDDKVLLEIIKELNLIKNESTVQKRQAGKKDV